jgi:hypothetical protein
MKIGLKKIGRVFMRVVFVCSVSFCIWNVWNVWQLATSNGGKLLVSYADDELRANLTAFTAANISQVALEQRLQSEVAKDERDWIVIQSLEEIAKEEAYELSEELAEALAAADDFDHSFLKTTTDCGRCAWNSGNCDFSIAMACGMSVSMTPAGDITGLSRAGLAYSLGEPVDDLDLVLSAVGLSATLLTITTGGSSLTVKAGAGFLRFAHLTGNIPASIQRSLRNAATRGIDWPKLPTVRNASDLATILRIEELRPAINAAISVGAVVGKTSPQQGLYLLKNSKDLTELMRISSVADVLEDQTVGYFAVLGKSRVLRATLRLSDEVIWLAIGVFGMASSLLFIMSSAVASMCRYRFQKWLGRLTYQGPVRALSELNVMQTATGSLKLCKRQSDPSKWRLLYLLCGLIPRRSLAAFAMASGKKHRRWRQTDKWGAGLQFDTMEHSHDCP